MSARGWWRSNALPLGILVVLLPASAWSIGWHDRTVVNVTYLDRITPSLVDEGDTTDLSGATWGPIRSAMIPDTSGMTPPPNTQVLAVAIPVHIDPEHPVRCDRPVLIEQSTGREWNEMSYELGLTLGSTDAIDCVFDAAEDYEMIVPFVVPEDAEGPYWVDVVPYADPDAGWAEAAGGTGFDGRFVRFSIDPR